MDSETIEAHRRLILDHETWFADTLALRVLERPRLSIWMILIPVIFVWYFFRYQKFTEGRRQFVENYLETRTQALEAAVEMVSNGTEPDAAALAGREDVPELARPAQTEFLAVLIEHYAALLRADGPDFPALARSACRDRETCLLVLTRLGQAEHRVNDALAPHLRRSFEGIGEVIRELERQSEHLRRELTASFFT